MVRPNKLENASDITNYEHENDIQAKRVTQIDSNGNKIDENNPLDTKDVNINSAFIPEHDAIRIIKHDLSTEIIDLKLNRKLDDLVLLQPTVIDTRVIEVNIPTVIPTIQDTVCLKNITGVAFYQGQITTIVANGGGNYTLTLDSLLDFAFSVDDGCSLSNTNLAVDGSITPVTFSISPGGLVAGTKWHITRFILLFGGPGIGAQNDPPDDSDFAVTTALTNGILIRMKDGIIKNIFNAKTNGDLRGRTYDVTYVPKSRAGLYTVATRRSFGGEDKNGVVIELNSDSLDEFQLIVQDNLTENTGGQMVVQGHVVEVN